MVYVRYHESRMRNISHTYRTNHQTPDRSGDTRRRTCAEDVMLKELIDVPYAISV